MAYPMQMIPSRWLSHGRPLVLPAMGIALFWQVVAGAQSPPPPAQPDTVQAWREVSPDRLWSAQQPLIDKSVEGFQPRVAGKANVYAMAVAGQGSQQLFSREAQLALKVAGDRFGGAYRGGALLSNVGVDFLHSPLATPMSVAAVARGMGTRVDPAEDVAFLYLASHGAPDAWIATELPDERPLVAISAASVAQALQAAGISRRIIVISACYAASWIPALANDDTIVITAAAEDRTSFGCDDSRRLTYFGEAFLEGPLARGASLKDAFEAARRTVSRWEAQEKLVPSMPQAYVGKNMQAVWTQPGANMRSPAKR